MRRLEGRNSTGLITNYASGWNDCAAEAETEFAHALSLLKRAGDALDIERSQKIRALRFQILQFLENNK